MSGFKCSIVILVLLEIIQVLNGQRREACANCLVGESCHYVSHGNNGPELGCITMQEAVMLHLANNGGATGPGTGIAASPPQSRRPPAETIPGMNTLGINSGSIRGQTQGQGVDPGFGQRFSQGFGQGVQGFGTSGPMLGGGMGQMSRAGSMVPGSPLGGLPLRPFDPLMPQSSAQMLPGGIGGQVGLGGPGLGRPRGIGGLGMGRPGGMGAEGMGGPGSIGGLGMGRPGGMGGEGMGGPGSIGGLGMGGPGGQFPRFPGSPPIGAIDPITGQGVPLNTGAAAGRRPSSSTHAHGQGGGFSGEAIQTLNTLAHIPLTERVNIPVASEVLPDRVPSTQPERRGQTSNIFTDGQERFFIYYKTPEDLGQRVNITKIGYCNREATNRVQNSCMDECFTDAQCGFSMKCCPLGCSLGCIPPYFPPSNPAS